MKRLLVLLFALTVCVSCTTPSGINPSISPETSPQLSVSPLVSLPPSPAPSLSPTAVPEDSTLTVHFIDVGQADAALLICDDETMLIDGGNVADSSLIVSYVDKLDIDHLNYLVATHAHEDHVGGLAGALAVYSAGTVYSSVTEYETKAFGNFVKYVEVQGLNITIPSAGDTFTLGSADVEILGPQRKYSDPNDTSIVLRVDFGATSFLFTGDAERDAELDMLDAGCDLSATVLKVGHHGSDTSTAYTFLREVMPEYAVISCGENNSYGHPTEAVLSRLRDAEVAVYRTDMQGYIVAVSDGTTVTFLVERNADVVTNPT